MNFFTEVEILYFQYVTSADTGYVGKPSVRHCTFLRLWVREWLVRAIQEAHTTGGHWNVAKDEADVEAFVRFPALVILFRRLLGLEYSGFYAHKAYYVQDLHANHTVLLFDVH